MSTTENDEIYEGLYMLFNEDCLSSLLSDEQYKLEEIAEEPEDVTVIPDHFFHPRNYLPFWTDPAPYEDVAETSPSAVLALQTAIPSVSSATSTSLPTPEAHTAVPTPHPSTPPLPTAQDQYPASQELAQPSNVQQEQHVNMGIGSTPSNPPTPLSAPLNAPISLPSTTVPAAIADTNAMPSAVAGAPVAAANTDAPNTLYNTNSPAALPITNNTPAAAPDAHEAVLRALYAANQAYPTPPNSSRVPTPLGPQQMTAYPLFPPYAHIPVYALVPYHAQIPTYGPPPAYMHHPAYAPMLPYAPIPMYAPYPMQVPAPQGPMQVHNAPSAQAYYAPSSAPRGGAAAPTNIAPLSNGATAGPTSGAGPTNGMPSRHYRPHVYEAARVERAAQVAQSLEAPQPVRTEVFQISQSTQGVQTAPAAQGVQTAHAAQGAQTARAAQVSQAAQSAEISQTAHAAQVSQPAHSAQDSQPAQAARDLSVQVAQTARPSPQVLHAGLPALKRKRDESEAEQEEARDAAGQQGVRNVMESQPCRWKHGREPCTRFFDPQNFQTTKELTDDVLAHLERVVVIPKDTSADPQKKKKTRVACGWALCARDFATLEAVAQHVALRHILGIPCRTSKKAKTSH